MKKDLTAETQRAQRKALYQNSAYSASRGKKSLTNYGQ